VNSGRIPGPKGENWKYLDSALRSGHRALPGKSSLARLLAEKRGLRNIGRYGHLQRPFLPTLDPTRPLDPARPLFERSQNVGQMTTDPGI